MRKLKAWLVLDLDGEKVIDSFDSKEEAVTWSVMYDGTFESRAEYLARN